MRIQSNTQRSRIPQPMPSVIPEEEMRRRREAQYQAQVRAQNTQIQTPVNLAISTKDPWGKDGSCLGLKILCGVFALIVVILVIVMIVRMTKKHDGVPPSDMAMQSNAPGLPMSLAGGAIFDNESFMSTGSM